MNTATKRRHLASPQNNREDVNTSSLLLLPPISNYLAVDNSKSSTFLRSASLMFGCGDIGTPPVTLSQ